MKILLHIVSVIILLSCSAHAMAAQDAAVPENYRRAHEAASQLPRLHSLLISRGDELVFEKYYNDRDPSRPANMKSASKSVISALVGIAIDQGLIDSVDVKLSEYFPELRAGNDTTEKQQITIENLLTMQSGLESTSNRNYGKWVLSDNWVEFVLNQPLVAEPGTRMLYSTGSTHLLSAILTKASGMSAKQFAQDNLAAPLGFSMSYWPQDPQGIYFGGNDMEMTPRQMLQFGRLYLNDGIYGDEQVIPSAWVQESHQPRARSPRGQGRFYGYGWWLRDLAGMQVPVAWGYGGQLIFVVRELDLVVVATSESTPSPSRRGHLGSLYDLVQEHVLLPARVQQLSRR
ncbi:MAG: serine hydrolase [Pseudohongiellaceae bacterium]